MRNVLNIEINNYIPKIIDYYVQLHGEEYREIITKKILNIDFNFYSHPDDLEYFIRSKKTIFIKSLIKEYLKKLNIEPIEEIITKLFNSCSTLDGTPMDEVYELIDDKELSAFQKNRAEYFFNILKEELKKDNPQIEDYQIINLLNQNKQFFKLIKEKETNFKLEYQMAYKQIDEFNRIKRRNILSANLMFLYEFKDLLSEHDLNILKNALNGEELKIKQLECKDILIGNSFEYKMAIDSFSIQDEEKLKGNNHYLKKTVEEARIKYYKSKGINLGDDYKLYEENEECQNIRPTFALADKISKRRKEYAIKVLEDCISKNREYIAIKEHTRKLNLEDCENFNEEIIREKETYISTNFVKENGISKEKPILYFCYTKLPEFTDVLLNHEINHALELTLIEERANEVHFQNGYEYIITKKGKQDITFINRKRRNTELFNEVINHLIAEEVTTMMHNDNFYIFNNETNAKILGATITTFANSLIKPFFDYYKDIILESRLLANPDILFDKIGKENFYELNDQINELFTIDRYKYLNDKKSNLITDETKKYDEVRSNILEIYRKIKEYERIKKLS